MSPLVRCVVVVVWAVVAGALAAVVTTGVEVAGMVAGGKPPPSLKIEAKAMPSLIECDLRGHSDGRYETYHLFARSREALPAFTYVKDISSTGDGPERVSLVDEGPPSQILRSFGQLDCRPFVASR